MTPPSPETLSPRAEARAVGRWLAAVRRSGLLSRLSDRDWRTLSALLSFRARDGRCLFDAEQLAYALGIPEAEASARLEDLAGVAFGETPLLTLDRDAEGRVAGCLLADIDLFHRVIPSDAPGGEAADGGDEAAADRADGYPAPAPEPVSEIYAALEAVGLYADQIERLLRDYPEERVRRQLAWLPARKARIPAALLVRAVEGDWGAPKEEA